MNNRGQRIKTAISFVVEQLKNGSEKDEKYNDAIKSIGELIDFIDLALKADLEFPLTFQALGTRTMIIESIKEWPFFLENTGTLNLIGILAYLRRTSRMLQTSLKYDPTYQQNIERLQEFVDLLIDY